MAQRRMFAKTIIDSDAFLDMPATSQLLYFHLAMRADDDGFINQPKTIMRICNCTQDDMKILVTKKFVIPFDTGIVVIKHWKIHNYIAKDRYTETKYKEEKAMLTFDENKAYTSCIQTVDNSYTFRIQAVHDCETQDSIDKDSIDKDNINILSDSDGQYRTISDNIGQTLSDFENINDQKKAEIDDFFERIWRLYPNKVGKSAISDSKKRKLFKIGYDEMERAINRYIEYLKANSDWLKPQNGSTFFNGRYIDYLDKNYVPVEKGTVKQNKTAQQLDDFYSMAAEWANERSGQNE